MKNGTREVLFFCYFFTAFFFFALALFSGEVNGRGGPTVAAGPTPLSLDQRLRCGP